ncbi:hypothetical protein Nepgr_023001 [Nepenthes gracilis]|uniref:Uncharacterized protein n=1 Tax=Nepenthes gracilis TaxID=150966 RepID=A0AAD3T1T6_NEPGR|nr:hypothetical protein Nepgr_023001 [Nepenthes gracilis]
MKHHFSSQGKANSILSIGPPLIQKDCSMLKLKHQAATEPGNSQQTGTSTYIMPSSRYKKLTPASKPSSYPCFSNPKQHKAIICSEADHDEHFSFAGGFALRPYACRVPLLMQELSAEFP